MTSGMQKKTTEKDIAVGRVRVISGHDEVGGIDITTELGSIAKGMVTSAGESDFVGAFSKEDLSSIDLRQQPTLPADEREKIKLQDKDPEKQSGSDIDGEDVTVQELEAEAATPSTK